MTNALELMKTFEAETLYLGYELEDYELEGLCDDTTALHLTLNPNDAFELTANDTSLHTIKGEVFYEFSTDDMDAEDVITHSAIMADEINKRMNDTHLSHMEGYIIDYAKTAHPEFSMVTVEWAYEYSAATPVWVCEQLNVHESGL